MVEGERTGKRDLTYSTYHRTIGDKYYALDFDFVEWRNGRGIVALFECALNHTTSQQILQKKQFEFTVYTEASRKLQVPAYFVIYDKLLVWFEVYKIENEEATPWKKMNNEEYTEFLRAL